MAGNPTHNDLLQEIINHRRKKLARLSAQLNEIEGRHVPGSGSRPEGLPLEARVELEQQAHIIRRSRIYSYVVKGFVIGGSIAIAVAAPPLIAPIITGATTAGAASTTVVAAGASGAITGAAVGYTIGVYLDFLNHINELNEEQALAYFDEHPYEYRLALTLTGIRYIGFGFYLFGIDAASRISERMSEMFKAAIGPEPIISEKLQNNIRTEFAKLAHSEFEQLRNQSEQFDKLLTYASSYADRKGQATKLLGFVKESKVTCEAIQDSFLDDETAKKKILDAYYNELKQKHSTAATEIHDEWYDDNNVNMLMRSYQQNNPQIRLLDATLGTASQIQGEENHLQYRLREYHIERAMRLERGEDIENELFIPVNLNQNHWVLIHIQYHGPLAPDIDYFDPVGNAPNPEVVNAIRNVFPNGQIIPLLTEAVQQDGVNCGPWITEVARRWMESGNPPSERVIRNINIEQIREQQQEGFRPTITTFRRP